MKDSNKTTKVVIQGYPGCFHEEAARKFFKDRRIEAVPALTFNHLAKEVNDDNQIDYGIMAIENSIAGSILQNYRILREYDFRILGEVYLRIVHNLMALPGQSVSDIHEVASHPMALNQCLDYLLQQPQMRLVESEDTALSAKNIRDSSRKNAAAIASATAAELYGLEILASGVETSKQNYTRFFIIQNNRIAPAFGEADKASIYCTVPDKSGALLQTLSVISKYKVNISKLQSYPILDKISEYYFYIDLEIESKNQFEAMYEELDQVTDQLEILGLYNKASIHDHQTV